MNDPYACLGVARTATADEIEHAYRRLAMARHPDHANAADPAAVAAATRAFVALGEAHALLKDPVRRAAWNAAHPGPVIDQPEEPKELRHREVVAGLEVFHVTIPPLLWVGGPTRLDRTEHGLWLRLPARVRPPAAVLVDPELHHVAANGSNVLRRDVELMATNPSIRRIELADTAVDDGDVVILCRLPRLEMLRLDGTAVTDDACAHLARAPYLRELSLQDTAISDAGLEVLAGSASIRVLQLRGTRVTRKGLRGLDRMTLTRLTLPHAIHRLEEHHLKEAHPGILVT